MRSIHPSNDNVAVVEATYIIDRSARNRIIEYAGSAPSKYIAGANLHAPNRLQPSQWRGYDHRAHIEISGGSSR